jgi:ABC-type lipoprotein release transport system permease subunit
MATVPYFVYEGTAYRFERSQKALIIVTVIALILSCIVVIGAIVMMKMMSDMIDIYEAERVVRDIVDTARI